MEKYIDKLSTLVVNLKYSKNLITAGMGYNNRTEKGNFDYDTKVWWCITRHPAVIERFTGGISITMVCKGMRKKGYGYAWSTGQNLMKSGIHNIAKAQEFADMLFAEYGVFIPYIDLMGYRDPITEQEGSEI